MGSMDIMTMHINKKTRLCEVHRQTKQKAGTGSYIMYYVLVYYISCIIHHISYVVYHMLYVIHYIFLNVCVYYTLYSYLEGGQHQGGDSAGQEEAHGFMPHLALHMAGHQSRRRPAGHQPHCCTHTHTDVSVPLICKPLML